MNGTSNWHVRDYLLKVLRLSPFLSIYLSIYHSWSISLRLLSSGTKLFITFELKGFSRWGREMYNLSMTTFPSAPPPSSPPRAHPPQGLGELRKSTVFFPGRNSTNWLFSNLSPRFRCVTSFTSLVISSIWDFYCDISEWHILPARAWTPALMFAPK